MLISSKILVSRSLEMESPSVYRFWLSSSSFSCRDLRAATAFFPCLFRDGPNPSELRRERANAALQALIKVSSSGIVSAASLSANAIEATMSQRTCAWDKYSPALEAKSLKEIIYVFLTIFLYLLKCPQSLILSALRAFCFCGKPHISRSIFLYFRYQSWLKSW